jgi:hypothetical protein
MLKACEVNSAETIPVGTAMIPYPKTMITEAINCPKGLSGAISP